MKAILFVALIGLVALAAANAVYPNDNQWYKCDNIGWSTGCSGCANNLTGCEWCAVNINTGYPSPNQGAWFSGCAPKGWCADVAYNGPTSQVTEAVYEPANHLCLEDPLHTEGVYKGELISIPQQSEYSNFYASHYCEFPSEPWAIDRSVSYSDNDDASWGCHKTNLHLAWGNRLDIIDNCGVDLNIKQNQECLKLYQSFECTIACPEYGQPADFYNICFEDWHRLYQACSNPVGEYETFYDCLEDYSLIGFDYTDIDETDCYHITPDLIPASSKFEHDLCFFGDPARCASEDCEVKERTTLGYFADNTWECGYPYYSDGTDVNLLESAPNGICIEGEAYTYHGQNYFWNYFGLTLDIVSVEKEDGEDCWDQSFRYVANKYGGQSYEVDCNYAVGQCAIFVYADSYYGVLPTYCDSVGDPMVAYNVLPSEFQCLAEWYFD